MRRAPQRSRERAAVWVVEDNPGYRETLEQLLGNQEDLYCAHSFASGEDLIAHLHDHFAPEAMLVDIGLGEMDGIQVVERVSRISPATELVMLTIEEDNDYIFKAIRSGARGYLLKTATPDEIRDALRVALRGGSPMTPQIARRVLEFFTQLNSPLADYGLTKRETEVLSELTQGKTKKGIAKTLFLSTHTIDTHLRNIYAKLHVHTRTAAVAKALKEGLLYST